MNKEEFSALVQPENFFKSKTILLVIEFEAPVIQLQLLALGSRSQK